VIRGMAETPIARDKLTREKQNVLCDMRFFRKEDPKTQ
jgi:hypothetical protein